MRHRILPIIVLCGLLAVPALLFAATNIVSSPTKDRFAWNDLMGWIDFYTPDTAFVAARYLQGYASSSVGIVSLDCATAPNPPGNICSSSNYQVLNDGAGNLSGWAWSDNVGWISFCGTADGNGTASCPTSTVTYGVHIGSANGIFTGWAWSDTAGWVSFNCSDKDTCATSDYRVATTWIATSTSGHLDSFIFDTGVSGGAQINSVLWQGTLPTSSASVSFQFAVATTAGGPWEYYGPGGSTSTYYGVSPAVNPGTSIPVSYTLHNNFRYFRYRVVLTSNQAQNASPRVDDVSVNWSR